MSQIIITSGSVIVENNKVLLNKDKKDNFWKFCGGGCPASVELKTGNRWNVDKRICSHSKKHSIG